MISKNKYLYLHILVSIIFFIVSATYGWLMRLQHVFPLEIIEYSRILQAHSHVTFLGWGFLTTISLISSIFLSDNILNTKLPRITYWVMVFSLASLLVSFPLQGYKVFSIFFLTLFLLNSYMYLAFVYKMLKQKNSFSSKYIRTGIFYYYFSSLAIWLVPIIVLKLGKHEVYHNAIYFYLHFLYNGFFVFALFGLLINFFEKRDILFPKKNAKIFFQLTNIACIPAYALSLLWSETSFFVVLVGMLASIIQLLSLLYLFQLIKKLWSYIIHKPTLRLLLFVVSLSYYLKVLMQFFGSYPFITQIAITNRTYIIIGYLHLFTLGFMSLFLFLLLYIHTKFKLHKLGLFLFTLGILLSEILLFSQGLKMYFFKIGITNYNQLLLIASTFMPIGLLMILYNHFKTKDYQLKQELLRNS